MVLKWSRCCCVQTMSACSFVSMNVGAAASYCGDEPLNGELYVRGGWVEVVVCVTTLLC
jgi:hypothetical protein